MSLFFVHCINSELNVTDDSLLTLKYLTENVYYVKNQEIYRNADRYLCISTDNPMNTSKERKLLSTIGTYSCAHLVCMISTNRR